MSSIVLALGLAGCASSTTVTPTSSQGERTVNWQDLGTSIKVIGRLGVPLGSVVKIKATVVSGEDLTKSRKGFRIFPGRLLLVEEINGAPLDPKPTMYFMDHSEFPYALDDSEADTKLREAFLLQTPTGAPVGTVLELYAFETARMPGNPHGEVPDGSFMFISEIKEPDFDTPTFFRTLLHVCLIRNP